MVQFRVVLALALFIVVPVVQAAPQKRSASKLRADLDKVAADFNGTLGYSFHHLRTGDRFGLREDEQFPTGSTIKVAMMCAAFDLIAQGRIAYYDRFEVTADDISGGTGLMRNYRVGQKVTLKELLHLMITMSDNTAARMILKIVTAENINEWLSRNGFARTRFNVPYPVSTDPDEASRQLAPYRQWGMGTSTPEGMRMLMERIATGKIGGPAPADEMQRILLHQYFDDGIPGQLPPGTAVANKTGIERDARSDIAIVHASSGTYVIAIYTKQGRDTRVVYDNEHAVAIRAVSAAIWRHYHPDSKWRPPAGSDVFSRGPDW